MAVHRSALFQGWKKRRIPAGFWERSLCRSSGLLLSLEGENSEPSYGAEKLREEIPIGFRRYFFWVAVGDPDLENSGVLEDFRI